MSDDILRKAAAALREQHDGTSPRADATKLQILIAAQRRERARRRWMVIAMPLAAAFVVGTAWAGASGHLTPIVKAVESAFGAAPANENTEATRHLAPAPAAPNPVSNASEPTPEPEALVEEKEVLEAEEATAMAEPTATSPSTPTANATAFSNATSNATSTPTPTSTPNATATSNAAIPSIPFPSPPTTPSAGEPGGPLYMDAHRIHFVEKDPARAVAAWDAYLREAPNGRFAPEARYNRAIMLVRLGRRDEAIRELRPFAEGTFDGYRRDDARALIEALEAKP